MSEWAWAEVIHVLSGRFGLVVATFVENNALKLRVRWDGLEGDFVVDPASVLRVETV